MDKLKRIGFDDENIPYTFGIGGSKLSKDTKIMFFEKETNKHYTMRFISDELNGKLTLDIHSTDETKKRDDNTKYASLAEIIIDVKAMENDITLPQRFEDIIKRKIRLFTPDIELDGKVITPLPTEITSIADIKGKYAYIDTARFTDAINNTHNPDDLQQKGFTKAMVYNANLEEKEIPGVIFMIEKNWHYIDMPSLFLEIMSILLPYFTMEIDGKLVSREEVISELSNLIKSNSKLEADVDNNI